MRHIFLAPQKLFPHMFSKCKSININEHCLVTLARQSMLR